jgi:hypothetical protein
MVTCGILAFVGLVQHETARIVAVLENIKPQVARFLDGCLMVFTVASMNVLMASGLTCIITAVTTMVILL